MLERLFMAGTSQQTQYHVDVEALRGEMLSGKNGILDRMKELVGPKYHDATRACLEGMPGFQLPEEANQSDPDVGAHLQRAFVEQVVDCLKGIVV